MSSADRYNEIGKRFSEHRAESERLKGLKVTLKRVADNIQKVQGELADGHSLEFVARHAAEDISKANGGDVVELLSEIAKAAGRRRGLQTELEKDDFRGYFKD